MNNTNDSSDSHFVFEDNLQDILASRWIRFVASTVDSIILIAVFIPTIYLIMGPEIFEDDNLDNMTVFQDIVLSILTIALFFLINLRFLISSGQTIGKKLTGIKIVSMDYVKLSFTKHILPRYSVYFLLGVIPVIGPLLVLINLIYIFRSDHRCIHDHAGNTKVIRCQQIKYENKETRKQIPTSIKIIFVSAIALVIILMFTDQIRLSTGMLQEEIEQSIRETWAEKPSLANAEINSFILVHKTGNQYEGVLDVTQDGRRDKLIIDVTYDGNHFMWHVRK